MKIRKDGTAEFFWNGMFSPICGHWFWDNEYGAQSFCQTLGYTNGSIISGGKYSEPGDKYTVDAITIGKCYAGEELETCSGGCNDKAVGNGCAECATGESVKMIINCEGHNKGTEASTCKGNK